MALSKTAAQKLARELVTGVENFGDDTAKKWGFKLAFGKDNKGNPLFLTRFGSSHREAVAKRSAALELLAGELLASA